MVPSESDLELKIDRHLASIKQKRYQIAAACFFISVKDHSISPVPNHVQVAAHTHRTYHMRVDPIQTSLSSRVVKCPYPIQHRPQKGLVSGIDGSSREVKEKKIRVVSFVMVRAQRKRLEELR